MVCLSHQHMAKQAQGLDLAFLEQTANVFLIRDPTELLTSVCSTLLHMFSSTNNHVSVSGVTSCLPVSMRRLFPTWSSSTPPSELVSVVFTCVCSYPTHMMLFMDDIRGRPRWSSKPGRCSPTHTCDHAPAHACICELIMVPFDR